MVVHRARMDLVFLNKELSRVGRRQIPMAQGICIVKGMMRTLRKDVENLHFYELCQNFGIDLPAGNEEMNVATIHCHLLCRVYHEIESLRGHTIVEVKRDRSAIICFKGR